MLLSELLSKLRDVETENIFECEITSVTENSKHASETSIFVAKRGVNFDGADFIDDARARGAMVFVTEKNISLKENETLIISKNVRKTMAEILNILYGSDISKMKIIGITGTKGKTTTLKILSECIFSLGISLVSIGTLGAEFYGDFKEKISTENTTPDAPFIYETLSGAYKRGVKIAVIEVSSQAVVDYRVYGIPFTVCIFTNISPDHIGKLEHKSFEEYFEAKRSLFSEYKPDISVVNSDDPFWQRMTEGRERVIKVGTENSDFLYNPIFESDTCVEFSLSGEGFRLSVGGDYNGMNAALAIVTASLISGRDITEFKECLGNIKISGRYEVYSLNGIKIIIDFAHNKKSFGAICESVRRNTSGRLIVLFGSVGERCYARRAELASMAEKYADLAVITADNPGYESAERIALEIYSHFKNKSKAKIIADREQAIYYALSRANVKDTVLLLGKGQENFQLIGNERIPFSESEIIKKLGAKIVG